MKRSLCMKWALLLIAVCLGGPVLADAGDDLMQSIYKNNVQGVKTALGKGIDVNKTSDKGGNTPLMAASYKGSVAIMNLLIEKGAKIDDSSGYMGQTSLMCAAESGNIEAVKLLLDKGAKIKRTSIDGKTVLMFAAMGGNPAMVKFLAEKGLDVNARDKSGWTPLMHAAEKNKPETVKALISLKADLNARSTGSFSVSSREYSASFFAGDTALSIARAAGRLQVASILDAAGARSYAEQIFKGNEMYKQLGSYKVEMNAASKGEFKDIISTIKQALPNDAQKEQKAKAYDRLEFKDGGWFVAAITYEKNPGKNWISISLKDAKSKNLINKIYSYAQTARSGNTIVRYREVLLVESLEPVTKKAIGADRSPATFTTTLFKTNSKSLRFYTDEK
jgi:ankyrin repeat protein